MGKIIDRKANPRTVVNWKRQSSSKHKLKYSIILNIILGILLLGVLLDVI